MDDESKKVALLEPSNVISVEFAMVEEASEREANEPTIVACTCELCLQNAQDWKAQGPMADQIGSDLKKAA